MCAFNANHGRMCQRWVGGWCLVKQYVLSLINVSQKTFNCFCAYLSYNQGKQMSHDLD